ncbi:MAG: ZIP family metal transporter [Spirochaetia bacterium]|nr:ZIP family metal transporter [Spirochaetia bacterium]
MDFYHSLAAICLVSFLGGLLPLLYHKIHDLIPYFISFASGILISAALFRLLPESIEIIGKYTGFPMLVGFIVFYFPQKYVITDACDIDAADLSRLGMLTFLGIGFHSFTDGIGVGAAESGKILSHISFAVIAHKIPDALALSIILISLGIKKSQVIFYLAIFSFTTPFGALLTNSLLTKNSMDWVGYATGFSAGNFLAIAFGDILKKINEKKASIKIIRTVLLIAGCLVSLIDFGHG